MERRSHFYIPQKGAAVWLMELCMLASVAISIFGFFQLEAGLLWKCVLLPTVGAVGFGLSVLRLGEERLYKTAIPVCLLGICWGLQNPGALSWACVAVFCVLYVYSLSGQIRSPRFLLVLYLPALAAIVFACWRQTLPLLRVLPAALQLVGMTVLVSAVRVHRDGAYHPTWGDRPDGRRIRSIPPIDQIGPYIMVNRTGSNNLFSESVEITEAERYVRKKRREGLTGFGLTHVIVAAYVRTVAKYPALNRFIAGQKVYSRGEDISVSMTVKKELSAASPDTVIKAHFHPGDTAEDVYRKFSVQVEEAKNTPLDSNVDNTAGLLTLIPGLVLKFVVWLIKSLDYLGWVPAFLLEISPFHGSAYFTSMGSLGIQPVYHHLYDFGTIPVFCAFGRKRRAEEIVNGQITQRKYVDLKFNLDERICDGYYYASAIKHFLRLLSNPAVLDEPPVMVQRDVP